MKRLLSIAAVIALAWPGCRHPTKTVTEAKSSAAPEAPITGSTNAPIAVEVQPVTHARHTPQPEQLFPPGMFKFINVPVRPVLELYRSFSGLELTIEPNVDAAGGRVNLQVDRVLTRQEALTVLERTLLAQVGVKIIRTGEKRATVTHMEGNLR